ncbi:adenylosuccinate lyase family protein [Martelella lutilitoris]|uniref:Adenylosuccinate lyase family protein n=1 Tax=Martelella lutilitoris TaxID=2583532 RepID=A0A5C4JSC1_9HYPH|nr:lyase family protein [Martelella lutilitoris]TNB47599.1 adenylosuccinate lyase family protein [Martelella lutilitoris]
MTKTGTALTPETLFARETLWQSWLDVEAALAEVQADMGTIPQWAARDIRTAAKLETIGAAALEADIRKTLAPVMSLTRLLGEAAGKAGDYVHWGATTQNVMQTGRILLIREADRAIRGEIARAMRRLAALAEEHAGTVMAGRTNRQHALPITFGFKVAGWIEEMGRAVERLDDGGKRLFSLPFGGAVGAMHAFGPDGRALNRRLAEKLGLRELLVPGRTINDIFADYIVQHCLMAMTVERIMAEAYLLMTEEIGELSETLDAGTVGSSTMPHKVNPKFVVRVLAEAAELRGLAASAMETGRSSHEGDAATNQLLSSVLDRAVPLSWRMTRGFADTLHRIRVNPDAMMRNAELSGGVIATENLMMRLAPKTGRASAHDLVHHVLAEASAGGATRAEELLNNDTISKYLPAEEIRAALMPAAYCGDSRDIALKAAVMARDLAGKLDGETN